jgi:pimeloyl-ACP methyl ester carboxylesterase
VVYLPPADSWMPGFASDRLRIEDYQLDFVPVSGRALIWPIYSGTHERYDGFHAVRGSERAQLAIERNRRLRDEIGRLLDYLDDDPAFDGSRVVLTGLSHGAMMAAVPLALEPRLRGAVLLSVGIASMNPIFANPQNDPNVFWARVTQPVLVINGRYDPIRPHHVVMDRFIALLGTPAADKQGVLLDSGHWPLPRGQMVRLTLEWLDHQLGPVPGGARRLRARITERSMPAEQAVAKE